MGDATRCLIFEECKECPSGINCCICKPPPILLTREEENRFPKNVQEPNAKTGFSQFKVSSRDICLFFTPGKGCSLYDNQRPLECRLFPVIPYRKDRVLLSYRCLAVRNILFDEERLRQLVKKTKKLMVDAQPGWIQAMNDVFCFDNFAVKLCVDLNKEW